jgi:hypothetical protein
MTPLTTYAAQRHADGSALVWLLIAACVIATAWCLISEGRNRRH